MSWFTLAIVGVVTDSLSALLQRLLMKTDRRDPIAYAIVCQFLTAGLIFGFLIFYGFHVPRNIPYFNVILSVILVTVATLSIFKSLQLTEVSEYAIVRTTGVFWSLASAAVFLKETIGLNKILGSALVIAGIVLAVWQNKKTFKFHKGHLFALIASFAFGTAFTNDAFVVRTFDVPTYIFFILLMSGVLMLVAKPKAARQIPAILGTKTLAKMVVFCALFGISAITGYLAYQAGGDASQIYPINRSTVILTVVLGAVFLGERDNLWKKMLGAAIAFAGVLLIR